MKLRTFLATVPMAAVALALPEPKPSVFRGWWKETLNHELVVVFKSVERRSDGGRSDSEMTVYWRPSSYMNFDRKVRELEEAHSKWAAVGGTHPMFFEDLALST